MKKKLIVFFMIIFAAKMLLLLICWWRFKLLVLAANKHVVVELVDVEHILLRPALCSSGIIWSRWADYSCILSLDILNLLRTTSVRMTFTIDRCVQIERHRIGIIDIVIIDSLRRHTHRGKVLKRSQRATHVLGTAPHLHHTLVNQVRWCLMLLLLLVLVRLPRGSTTILVVLNTTALLLKVVLSGCVHCSAFRSDAGGTGALLSHHNIAQLIIALSLWLPIKLLLLLLLWDLIVRVIQRCWGEAQKVWRRLACGRWKN